MAVWYILLLSVIIGALANEHTPSNPPYVLEEVKATAESRVLERVEHLLQGLSAKIKVLDDGIDEMKRDISSLFFAQNETTKSLGNVSALFQSFSMSTIQRIASLGHKFGRFPENTGVYFMQPDLSKNKTFEVSRDWTNNHGFGGDWIVFQRRFNGSVDFYRNWTEYKDGFGDLRGEHWLGLDKLHAIVETRQHELLIVLEDFDGVIAYAHYDDFKIGDESEKYIIKSVGKYTGTAGDSFTRHKDEFFSTYDQDNDESSGSCSEIYKGAWWFYKCHQSHLNGRYWNETNKHLDGIDWIEFRGKTYSLKSSKMMVRPVA